MSDFFVSLAGVTAQRFVAGLIWDTLGKDVHQFLQFGCCGNGHLSIGGDVFFVKPTYASIWVIKKKL